MHFEGEEDVDGKVSNVFRRYRDCCDHGNLHFTDKVLFDGTFGGECVQYYECFDSHNNNTHAYVKLRERISPAAAKELKWLMKLKKASHFFHQFAHVLGFHCHPSSHCVIFKAVSCKLSDYLRRNELDLTHRHQLCVDICSGVHFLHSFSPRLIHCAVTPESVLVCAGGTARLCDLSRAHYLQGDCRRHKISEGISNVMSKLFRGTESEQWAAITKQKLQFTAAEQPYLSPECKTKQAVDDKHDVFSLGVVIMEVLTGDSPTPCDHIGKDEIGHRRSHDIEALRQMHLPAAEVVVEYCLQQDPAHRRPVEQVLRQLQSTNPDVRVLGAPPAQSQPLPTVSCCK